MQAVLTLASFIGCPIIGHDNGYTVCLGAHASTGGKWIKEMASLEGVDQPYWHSDLNNWQLHCGFGSSTAKENTTEWQWLSIHQTKKNRPWKSEHCNQPEAPIPGETHGLMLIIALTCRLSVCSVDAHGLGAHPPNTTGSLRAAYHICILTVMQSYPKGSSKVRCYFTIKSNGIYIPYNM